MAEDVCSRTVLEAGLSHLLDYLRDFACDEKVLGVYKRYVEDTCIKDYIGAYREMWEDERELENDL